MSDEIVNKVANSKLITVDLEDYYAAGPRIELDIKDWLYEGMVLREKEFRQYVREHDWSKYDKCYVALYCSSDAIIPTWAYMLIIVNLEPFVEKAHIGDLNALESSLYQDTINALDTSVFIDKPVIIKGCAHKPVPVNAYLMLTQKLKPIAKSIMYGEACSSVPVYKRK